MDDSYLHIVKRTDQWNERAVQSYVIPRGVLCVELTSDGKTKLKVGEGNKYYSQLPYIGNDIDISKYFTKEEIERMVKETSVETAEAYMSKQPYARVLGPVYPSADSLPKSGNKDGDIRFVKLAKISPDGKAFIEYIWFNNRWDPISSAIDVDVSKYATKEELAAVSKSVSDLVRRVIPLEQAKHIHPNKNVLDLITSPFTTEKDTKLSGIEEHANRYVLPPATRHSLGGVIIGTGITLDANGTISIDTSGIVIPPYDDTEVKRRISALESVEHTHSNKSVLDATTASYTTEEQAKLAELENYTLPVASSAELGGVKIGSGLVIDQDGVVSTTGGGGGGSDVEYVAGSGISISPGETSRDLTILTWEQGSIDAAGNDETVAYAIRSPFIQNGLTDRISVRAVTTGSQNMFWKLFYYDSDHTYYAQTAEWSTSPTLKVTPNAARCKYIKIVLVVNVSTAITPASLAECELSYPFEVGKHVITNTGVTHIELNGQNEITVTENSETSTLVKFGSDLEVTNGVVNIPDYHRLVLNVEE